METSPTDLRHTVTLPTNRAFVVQFCTPALGEQGNKSGRVEHLVSGQAAQFDSWAELQQFIEKVLAHLTEAPP